ncbi:hypothetical protein NMY22_g9321 [Coprinellus aureogranulatus]|nr:hypothetical protein NMY22_g9321 [Coprinellus aureogranulatus]
MLATWEHQGLNVEDPEVKGPEGRKCCPKEFVLFLVALKHATFDFNGQPRSNIVRDDYYRLDIQRRGSTFITLAIQSNVRTFVSSG